MKKVKSFEVVDNGERVFIEWEDGYWSEKKVYHIGEEGILCNDFETYIEFGDLSINNPWTQKTLENLQGVV